MRPAALHHLGLAPALREYVKVFAQNHGITAEFYASSMPAQRFAPAVETNPFRTAQEALTNVNKHAGATLVDVQLRRRDHSLVLTSEDHGVGFDTERGHSDTRIGARGMRERALLLGGTVGIESSPGSGTAVIVFVLWALASADVSGDAQADTP